jgi:hypothetical protein
MTGDETSTTSTEVKPTSTAPNFTKLHTKLGTNSLVKSTLATIPSLTGADNYVNWSDRVTNVFNYCGIDKIHTGDWKAPAVTSGDADSQANADDWKALDAWISLHLNLSEQVRSQVRQLKTSNAKWEELKKLFKPTSKTNITLHLTSTVNVRYDEATKFEDFVASKREHNRLLGELGGDSLPDPYIAIVIRSGLPDHLKQSVAHFPDDRISADELVNVIRTREQESEIGTMQSSPSDIALLGRQHKSGKTKKHPSDSCKTPGCPRPNTHPTSNCWAPGGPKHDPNRKRNAKRKGKEKAHKAEDDDDEDEDDTTTGMNINIDRSYLIQQSQYPLLYVSPPDSSTSSLLSQAYLAKGPTPIIIDSGTTSHIHTEHADFDFIDKDDTSNITGFGDGATSSSGRGTAVIWSKSLAKAALASTALNSRKLSTYPPRMSLSSPFRSSTKLDVESNLSTANAPSLT